MKLLFNKTPGQATGGSFELNQINGNFYANNKFEKIQTDIILETEKLVQLIGPEVYKIAEDVYHGVTQNPSQLQKDLVQHMQLAIAYAATGLYYKSTGVSHEDTGRKLKIDKANEATPWEWMLDRDDMVNERKAYAAQDRLISFLDKSDLSEWKDSSAQKSIRNLFVNSIAIFQNAYPIDYSGRFYYAVVPFITEIEQDEIGEALGEDKYMELLAWHKDLAHDNFDPEAGGVTDEDKNNFKLITLIRRAVPLLAMSMAVRRFSLNVLPEGVQQQFKSMMQTANASQAALPEIIERFSCDLDKKAAKTLDKLKQYLNRADPEKLEYQMLPTNNPCNKFFRT